jgi:hypothetical protein
VVDSVNVIQGEVLPEVVAHSEKQQSMLIGSTPALVVENATKIANILKGVIDAKGLSVNLRGQSHVKCEGWTTLGALLGVYPQESAVVVHEDGSVTATVELRTLDGRIISRGSGYVGMDEKLWANRPTYARRSMAITRATGKAFRLGFSWVITLAGYNPTPAEEMPGTDDSEQSSKPRYEEPKSVRYDNSASSKRLLADFCKIKGVTDVETLRTIAAAVDGLSWEKAKEIAAGICKDAVDLKNIFPIEESEKQS